MRKQWEIASNILIDARRLPFISFVGNNNESQNAHLIIFASFFFAHLIVRIFRSFCYFWRRTRVCERVFGRIVANNVARPTITANLTANIGINEWMDDTWICWWALQHGAWRLLDETGMKKTKQMKMGIWCTSIAWGYHQYIIVTY